MYHCPCCGYDGLELRPYADMPDPPWDEHPDPPYCVHYGEPTYDVCDCCSFEYGFEDEPGGGATPDSFETVRLEWIKRGCPWFYEHKKPEGWLLTEQLKRIGVDIDRLDLPDGLPQP